MTPTFCLSLHLNLFCMVFSSPLNTAEPLKHFEMYTVSTFASTFESVLAISSTQKRHMIPQGKTTSSSNYFLMVYKGTWVQSQNCFLPNIPFVPICLLNLPVLLNLKVSYKVLCLAPHYSFQMLTAQFQYYHQVSDPPSMWLI